MRKIITLLFFILPFFCAAQKRGNVWCFGDSALIDFSDTVNIIVGASGIDTRGSCISISSTSGQILYYAATMPYFSSNSFYATYVYDSTHSIMQNGDSLFGHSWYHELVTIPNPVDDSTYYIFSIGVTSIFGLYYSMVDMRLNNGLGAVSIKNVLLQNFEQVDCLNAIKHGNGRDWWLMFRKSDFSVSGSNNDWYTYLITPNSIQNFSIQNIGSLNSTNNGQICFSPTGNKLVFLNFMGLLEIYDFDRCTGLLSNNIIIEPEPTFPPAKYFWSCAISPDESKLYVSTNETPSYLFQYDLNAPNIASSKDTIWSLSYPIEAGGGLKLASDNKIYLSNWYFNGVQTPYPYADSVYNVYNMNLSVINSPDSLGTACNFQPYSFYLGGKRTYLGLPNNPDYDMPALAGSPCDSLTTGVASSGYQETKPQLFVTYINGWQKLFVNAQNLEGKNRSLQIFDITGKLILSNVRRHSPLGAGGSAGGYFTTDINCTALAKGMYIVALTTESEKLAVKFIKD